MKLAVLFIVTAMLAFSSPGKSQTLNFSGKQVPLVDIFSIIKNQTGIFFFYDASLLPYAKPVTMEWKNVPLETALNDIFKDQPLTWALEDKTVTVIKKPIEEISAPGAVGWQRPPARRVKGFVFDMDDNPINSVSVMIKGTKQGTISDLVGEFSINAEEKNVLVFSSVNYSSKELTVEKGEMNIKLQLDIKPMESTLVGGNINAIKRRADATSVTVLDSKTLEKIPVNTLDQVFRGWVPGVNSFDVGDEPEGFPALTIRGAGGPTSLSTIAVYIDGIQYAGGSGFLSQLDKTNIDRIEIVRGPGAATMYGTGSNGGIVQIFTKKDKTDQTSVNFTTSAGFYKSKWVKTDPFQQMHNLETTTASQHVALKLGGSFRTVDAYLPEGGEKNKEFYTGARLNMGKLQVNLTGRYKVRNYDLSRRPYYDTVIHARTDIIIEPYAGYTTPAYLWFSVMPTPSRNKIAIAETYTSGINLSHRTTENWVNNLDAGYTMNTSSQLPRQDGSTPLQRQYFSDKYAITTIRYSNTLTYRKIGSDFATVISSGAEFKKYSSYFSITRATAATSGVINDPDNENYGAFVQANPSYKNVYLTLGLRYEKNELFKAAWNPRIGLTTNFDTRFLTIKPRISWGKGITSPTYTERFGSAPRLATIVYANPHLKPQSQQGFDYGLEVYDKQGKFKMEVVYYDNILKDMIGLEMLGPDLGDPALMSFMSTNVGRVANTGWEFSGDYQIKRFNLQGTFSIMNSVIKDSTGSFILPQLKLPPGSRMVNLPKHTAGFNVTYNFLKLFGPADKGAVSLNVTEVDGVKSLDFRKYALDVVYGRTVYTPGIFGYPVENSPVFRVGLYVEYYILNDLRFFIQGSNILNDYKYEYSSEYPTHGATWLFGLKYNYSKSKE